MALSLTLGAVSAEDAVTADDAVAADVAVDEAPATEGEAAGGDVPVADLAVDVEAANETDDAIIWTVDAINYGPDYGYGLVTVYGSENLQLAVYGTTAGDFDPATGFWDVGYLAAGETATLVLGTYKVDEGPYYVEALIMNVAGIDPDLSNNYDIAWVGLDTSAAKETLPATGNPLAMAILALCAIGIGGIKRRF